MTVLGIERLALEHFSIAPTWDRNTLRMAFSGDADVDARAALEVFMKRVDEQSRAAKLQSVLCDMRNLNFMNSACFKCLVQWIDAIAKSDVGQQYRVNIIKNPKMPWQARSFESLRHFGPAVVFIEAEP